MVTPEQVREAADALARLEALYAALDDMQYLPHGALPVSFYSAPAGATPDETGTKVFYQRDRLESLLRSLIFREEEVLYAYGVRALSAYGENPFDVRRRDA